MLDFLTPARIGIPKKPGGSSQSFYPLIDSLDNWSPPDSDFSSAQVAAQVPESGVYDGSPGGVVMRHTSGADSYIASLSNNGGLLVNASEFDVNRAVRCDASLETATSAANIVVAQSLRGLFHCVAHGDTNRFVLYNLSWGVLAQTFAGMTFGVKHTIEAIDTGSEIIMKLDGSTKLTYASLSAGTDEAQVKVTSNINARLYRLEVYNYSDWPY